jgi:GT2 family glycosyltransferase
MVFIITVNWCNWRDTVECLESLCQLTYHNYRIVVVDNGSTDDSLTKIRDWASGKSAYITNLTDGQLNKPDYFIEYDQKMAEQGGLSEHECNNGRYPSAKRIVLLRIENNLGFAGGNNVGIRYALKCNADYVWLLNNDTIIDKEALSEAVNLISSDNRIGMVGSKVYCYDKPNIFQAAGGGIVKKWQGKAIYYGMDQEDYGQWNNVLDLEHILGASLLVSLKLIRAIGMLNEDYFLCMEEADWCVRAKRNKWRLVYCPNSKVWHKGSASFVGLTQLYYNQRNALLFTKINFPIYLPIVLLSSLIWKVGKRLIRGKFSEAFVTMRANYHFIIGRFGKAI